MTDLKIYSIKGTNETKRYTILAIENINANGFIKNLALLQRIISNGNTFIVASNLVIDNEKLEIEWDFGNYYTDIISAVNRYAEKFKEITDTADVPFNPPYIEI